jgi:Arf-GAP with coiled-coil, ANK repeat and PH domain-containing protein
VLGDRLVESNYSLIPESCNLFTNSDQESTSGEEDVLGKLIKTLFNVIILTFISTDEEEIDKLHPNYVLYKATTAHNLPVMCQAISLGADKNWENPDNLNRAPLHQAILAVSFRNLK